MPTHSYVNPHLWIKSRFKVCHTCYIVPLLHRVIVIRASSIVFVNNTFIEKHNLKEATFTTYFAHCYVTQLSHYTTVIHIVSHAENFHFASHSLWSFQSYIENQVQYDNSITGKITNPIHCISVFGLDKKNYHCGYCS